MPSGETLEAAWHQRRDVRKRLEDFSLEPLCAEIDVVFESNGADEVAQNRLQNAAVAVVFNFYMTV